MVVAISVAHGRLRGGWQHGHMNRPVMHEPGRRRSARCGGALLGAAAYSIEPHARRDHRRDRRRLAGGAVGAYMDKPEAGPARRTLAQGDPELEQARVDELPNHVLRVTMTGDTGVQHQLDAQIKPGFHSTMDKIADVVTRYSKTTLTVAGHTDDVGTAQVQPGALASAARTRWRSTSSRSASSAVRLAIVGKGESMPIASNTYEGGRAANRRVEIYVEPVAKRAECHERDEAKGLANGPHQLRRPRVLALPAALVRQEHGLLERDARPPGGRHRRLEERLQQLPPPLPRADRGGEARRARRGRRCRSSFRPSRSARCSSARPR